MVIQNRNLFVWWICVVIVSWIVTGLIVYYIREFWDNKSRDIIAKRRPVIVMILIVGLVLNMIIIRPLAILFQFITIKNDNSYLKSSSFDDIMKYFTFLIALLLLLRMYFMYYDFEKNKQLLRQQWTKKLKRNELIRLHWTIKYERYCGNSIFMLSLIITLWIISSVVIGILSYNNSEAFTTVYLIIPSILSIIPGIILIFLIQNIHDQMGIRREVRELTFISLLSGILWVIIILTTESLSIERELSSWILFGPLWSIFVGIRMIRIKLIELPNDTLCNELKELFICVNNTSRSDSNTSDSSSIIKLEEVLGDEHGFGLFASHCVNEFSVESILYLFELSVLKTKIVNYGWLTDNDIGWEFQIAKNMIKPYSNQKLTARQSINTDDGRATQINSHTRSTSRVSKVSYKKHIKSLSFKSAKNAVFSKDETNLHISECIHFIQYLYYQYICDDSILMVNISHKNRQKLKDLMDKYNDLFTETESLRTNSLGIHNNYNNNDFKILDLTEKQQIRTISNVKIVFKEYAKTGKEMYLLLNDSFRRFCETNEFKNWKVTRKDSNINKYKRDRDRDSNTIIYDSVTKTYEFDSKRNDSKIFKGKAAPNIDIKLSAASYDDNINIDDNIHVQETKPITPVINDDEEQ